MLAVKHGHNYTLSTLPFLLKRNDAQPLLKVQIKLLPTTCSNWTQATRNCETQFSHYVIKLLCDYLNSIYKRTGYPMPKFICWSHVEDTLLPRLATHSAMQSIVAFTWPLILPVRDASRLFNSMHARWRTTRHLNVALKPSLHDHLPSLDFVMVFPN